MTKGRSFFLLLLAILGGAFNYQYGAATAKVAPAPQARGGGATRRAPRPIRKYFIAAEKVKWSYAALGKELTGEFLSPRWAGKQTYDKYHYVQYTDDTFTTPVRQPPVARVG